MDTKSKMAAKSWGLRLSFINNGRILIAPDGQFFVVSQAEGLKNLTPTMTLKQLGVLVKKAFR